MSSKLCRQIMRQFKEAGRNSSSSTSRNASAQKSIKSMLVVGAFVALGLTVGSANALPPGTEDEIRERLVPAGKLCRVGDDCGVVVAAGPATPRSGEEVYNQFCVACHSTGVGGAPKTADAAAWEPRIAKGMDALWGTMQNGLNAMPPKGTCMNCSEDELRASMKFLVDSAQ